jgi:hypothetical protein
VWKKFKERRCFTMVEMQNVDYKAEGKLGRQCKDCKFYEPEANDKAKRRDMRSD